MSKKSTDKKSDITVFNTQSEFEWFMFLDKYGRHCRWEYNDGRFYSPVAKCQMIVTDEKTFDTDQLNDEDFPIVVAFGEPNGRGAAWYCKSKEDEPVHVSLVR